MRTAQEKKFEQQTAALFRLLGQPTRLRILRALGNNEACVCHLEAMLGLRQAHISQHLMALRDSGLVTSRREGKFIFYRLKSSALLDLIAAAAGLVGVAVPENRPKVSEADCICPSCIPEQTETTIVFGGSSD